MFEVASLYTQLLDLRVSEWQIWKSVETSYSPSKRKHISIQVWVKHGKARSKTSVGLAFLLAISNGVSSWQFFCMGFNLGCNNKTNSVFEDFGQTAARCKGVWPPVVLLFTSAPHASKVSTQDVRFHLQAEWRGVQPSAVSADKSAPKLSKITKLSWKKNK